MISLEQCLTTSRGKTHEKKVGDTKLGFLCHFLKLSPLVFVDIADDWSLGQCQTSSRTETSKKKKKKKWPKLGSNRPKLGSNRPKLGLKWGFPAFSSLLKEERFC